MKIILAYIAVTGGPLTHDYAARFVGSYLAHPPGVEHETVVACNGGPLPLETGLLFSAMPNTKLFPRQNDGGWDVSAYQDIAANFPCDMLVCCGETFYLHRAGWLFRLAAAWHRFGRGMYGSFSSNLVRAHLNTTGFAVCPQLLLGYSTPTSKAERYEFEHGQKALWRRVQDLGRPVRLVTWDGEYTPMQWRRPPNIMWRGNQTNCLAFCSHTDRYRAASPNDKHALERGADGPFC